MKSLMLFTDGSVHPPSRTGYGAYLVTSDLDADSATLKKALQLRRFENTSSTRLEIETLIWALKEIQPRKLIVFSDSQNIIGLPARRNRLEAKHYYSAKNVPLKHADLYKEFFHLTDQIGCTFVKVKGHRQSKDKSRIEHLFTLVDRASRQALRAALAE